MATYDYRCLNPHCKKVFERFGKRIDDRDSKEECPKCGTSSERVLSGGQLIIIN